MRNKCLAAQREAGATRRSHVDRSTDRCADWPCHEQSAAVAVARTTLPVFLPYSANDNNLAIARKLVAMAGITMLHTRIFAIYEELWLLAVLPRTRTALADVQSFLAANRC
jgi:hypothetical protein